MTASYKDLKVLVVDDQSFMFMMISNNLKAKGFEHIDYAPSGIKAIDMIEKENYDLITCDITMPEMDGIQTAKRIFQKNPNQKLIMVTAMGQEAIIKKAVEIGVRHYLLKPFTPETLIQKIEAVINS